MDTPTTPLCAPAARYTHHVIVSSAPHAGMGRYQRIGVIEVDHHERPVGYTPKRIADIRGCSVIAVWDHCNVGKTPACASERAKAGAFDLAREHALARYAQSVDDWYPAGPH